MVGGQRISTDAVGLDTKIMSSFPPSSSLLRLPEELRIEVLSHLDLKSLIRCRLVRPASPGRKEKTIRQ